MESDNRPQMANTPDPLILCIRSALLHLALQKRILGADSRRATLLVLVHQRELCVEVWNCAWSWRSVIRVEPRGCNGVQARRGADSRRLRSMKPVEC